MDELKHQIDEFITRRSSLLAEKIVERQYALQPEFWEKFGEEGRKISVRDAAYHLPFLTEAILADNPETFKNYISWVKTLFHNLHFPDEVMIVTLECTRDVLLEDLPEPLAKRVSEYIGYGIDRMHEDVDDLEPVIHPSDNLGIQASQFMHLLLEGKRFEANQLIMSLADEGVPVKDIYLDIFQKSQYEIGNLWLSGKISVAQEHYCSAATQLIISSLYPRIFSSARKGQRFIAACVGGELHEMGIRMVADFFEMDGWDTYYLGANTPPQAILRALEENDAQLLGLSVAMPFHLSLLKETIGKIRDVYPDKNLKILIGGNAIKNGTIPLDYFGADGFAFDAQQAVEIGNQVLNLS